VAGSYVLTATVADNNGSMVTSVPVAVLSNQPPTVTITSPLNGANLVAGSTVNIQATAGDSDGSVSQMAFYANGSQLADCVFALSPSRTYTCPWLAVTGAYIFTATVTDNQGAVIASAPVNVTVNQLPQVSITSPVSGSSFIAGSQVAVQANASDADGGITQVAIFENGVQICIDTAAPYECTWSPQLGEHFLTAQALDNLGGTAASQPVRIDVTTNQPPQVTITSPATGSNFPVGSQVTVQANASDNDGGIAQVTFFDNDVQICTASAAPFECTWTPQAGEHTLTARALDNLSGVTFSAPVRITVTTNQPPKVTISTSDNRTQVAVGETVTIQAEASDTDGSIVQVAFFANGVPIPGCVDTAAPFVCSWTPLAGAYAITARATDNQGSNTTSALVNLTVSPPGQTAVVFVPLIMSGAVSE
jgi:chitodextrinase